MLMLNFYNIYGNNDDIDVNENCNRSPCREILTLVILI